MKLDELAEVCGIHAGDGYLRNDGKRIELDISGSLEEKVYYEIHVIPLFSKLFKTLIKGRFFHSRNTYGFVIRDKNIVNIFHNLEFPYGNKSLCVKVPKFILESDDDKIKKLFLRGILDTDGSISFDRRYSKNYDSFKRRYHTYPRLTLSTVSKELSNDLQKLLNDLKIDYWVQTYRPKSSNEKTKNVIWIRGKSFEKWMKLIGSKNPVKYSRFEIWKKHGFCHANTTYKERIEITPFTSQDF